MPTNSEENALQLDLSEVGFVFIPGFIMSRRDLTVTDKLVYGRILGFASSSKYGYCFATNAWLIDQLDISLSQLKNSLSKLEAKGLIQREVVRNTNNEVKGRNIYPVLATPEEVGQNLDEGGPKSGGGRTKNGRGGLPQTSLTKNGGVSDTRIDNSSYEGSVVPPSPSYEVTDSDGTDGTGVTDGTTAEVPLEPRMSKKSTQSKKPKENTKPEPKPKTEKKPKELHQTPRYLVELPEADAIELEKKYDLEQGEAKREAEACHRWMTAKGILYLQKDYRAYLEGWIDKDWKREQREQRRQQKKVEDGVYVDGVPKATQETHEYLLTPLDEEGLELLRAWNHDTKKLF